MSLWAGQASSLARKESAQQIVERVLGEVKVTVENLQSIYKKTT